MRNHSVPPISLPTNSFSDCGSLTANGGINFPQGESCDSVVHLFNQYRETYGPAGFLPLASSHFAIDSTCTSSGPSANRSVRAIAQEAASNVSVEPPAPPCA